MRMDNVEGAEVKCPCCNKDLFVLMKAKGSKVKEFQVMKRGKKKVKEIV